MKAAADVPQISEKGVCIRKRAAIRSPQLRGRRHMHRRIMPDVITLDFQRSIHSIWRWLAALAVLAALQIAMTGKAVAIDPPHTNDCFACHMTHNAPGGAITNVAGNPNLCMSCHTAGGLAAAYPFADVDQALPGVSGTSHRWDSGPSGHTEADLANSSTGTVISGGAFSGRIAKTYTLTITTGGDAGTARFNWSDTTGGAGTDIATGTDVALDEGITVTFTDGTASPSFLAGDSWQVFVRTDLLLPSSRAMSLRIEDGKIMCSTCHDQHSQVNQPFDPAAPAYGGSGTGAGRHFQRLNNDTNQMCVDCHAPRNVTATADGSHPVGVPVPALGEFQNPSLLPLDAGNNVVCMTCHQPHFTPSTNGMLTRLADGVALCSDCHTLADTATPASHLDSGSGVLWPGGQYGSSFPQITDANQRGACINCHQPHGSPDDANPGQDYPKLFIERYDLAGDGSDPDDAEDLCYTCHDGAPTTNIMGEFAKGANTATNTFHHPVQDSEQLTGRSVECVDCHNPHRARADNKLAGVAGVDLAGNDVGPGTGNPRDAEEYEVCLKCHGDTYVAGRDINADGNPDTSNKRLDFALDASAYHPVSQVGRNQSTALNQQLQGGLTTNSTIKCTDCHNNEQTSDADGPAANSTASPKGPHGSTIYPILRDTSDLRGIQPERSADPSQFQLCFTCHNQQGVLARRVDEGARTNFYGGGRDSLHEFHIVDMGGATCRSCHYNSHGNQSAGNTIYRIVDGGTTDFNSPPVGYKTRGVNFSPDIQPNNFARPMWQLNVTTRARSCDLVCHGTAHDLGGDFTYDPQAEHGLDDDTLTY